MVGILFYLYLKTLQVLEITNFIRCNSVFTYFKNLSDDKRVVSVTIDRRGGEDWGLYLNDDNVIWGKRTYSSAYCAREIDVGDKIIALNGLS